jgi:DNA invertase Pin-like site-specific DNA recombinase
VSQRGDEYMKVTKIEQKTNVTKRLRAAAYTRVSDGKDAMLRSLSAQVSYYSAYIQGRKDWTYIGVFSDEAVTGTKDERSGFQKLLAECRAGNIDVIITKSVSRFARNTVILLETARELRQIGIDIYFEKENIHTLSGEGEFMLSLLASFSQEESRSVSENVKWGVQKKFQAGELAQLRFMYGYNVSKDAVTVNEEQAAVVRRIFSMYLEGSGVTAIAGVLRNENIPCLKGGVWTHQRVANMLRNEKYTGNALLQKTYVTDHLTKKQVRNRGERMQYYAENTHPAIIAGSVFDAVQSLREEHRKKYEVPSGKTPVYAFTGRITCEHCGKTYRRRIVGGKAWRICGSVVSCGRCDCQSKRIPEDTLIAVTVKVLGLRDFDESVFIEEIASIIAADNNTLRFVFKDGGEVSEKWTDKSRRDSWTPEMRETARQREIIRRRSEI